MIRRFPCKRSPFVYVNFGASMLGTFIAFIIRGADSLDIEYIATHLFLLFTLYGIFIFTLLTINVEVSDRNITCRCLGIPVVIIDIKSIKSIKPAEKHEVNMFASAYEQITISYTGYGDKLTVALRDNEGFISTVNAVKSGEKPAELKKPDKTKSIVRLIVAVFFIVANAVISLGELWQWVYTYPAVGVIIVADIVFMTMYVKSYSLDSAEG